MDNAFTMELYDKAIVLVRLSERASTSFISRELGINYLVAVEIMLKLEKNGVVSSPNYVGKREVYK